MCKPLRAKAKSIAYLRNPTNPVFAESEARELQAAARAHAVGLLFVNASRPSEFETAFADLVQQGADALVVSSAVSLLTDPDQIVALAARHAVPAIYAWRPSMAVGGLMSYATNLPDAWRQAGVYTRPDSQGRKTCRFTGLAVDQV
jgi:putative ABC transport system substrate-binding protein